MVNFRNTAKSTHKYSIGQSVQIRTKPGVGIGEIFEITRKLPMEGTDPEYRIKSRNEEHERVVSQNLIEAIDLLKVELDNPPVRSAFRDISAVKGGKRAKNPSGPWSRK